MFQIITELFLEFRNSFISSNSDFWWEGRWKINFAAAVGNFMAMHYKFKNGLVLAMSTTTFGDMVKSGDAGNLLKSNIGFRKRCSGLLDFKNFKDPKTGVNIGYWLDDCHRACGAIPDYTGIHIVDGASNATASSDVLELETSGERTQVLITDNCDSHKVSTTSNQASGTSDHVVNLNPACGVMLEKLHKWFGLILGNGQRQKCYNNVKSEHERDKSPALKAAVVTRWNSRYTETVCANANQYDIDCTIKRLVSPIGLDSAMYKKHHEEGTLKEIIIQEDEWEVFQQYEGGMEPLKELNVFTQSAKVVVHYELYESRRCLEQLSANFFTMYDNVSRFTGNRTAKDLTIRPRNQLVKMKDLNLELEDNEYSEKYKTISVSDMKDEVALARRHGFRILIKRLGYAENGNTLARRNPKEYENNITLHLMGGLVEKGKLPAY